MFGANSIDPVQDFYRTLCTETGISSSSESLSIVRDVVLELTAQASLHQVKIPTSCLVNIYNYRYEIFLVLLLLLMLLLLVVMMSCCSFDLVTC